MTGELYLQVLSKFESFRLVKNIFQADEATLNKIIEYVDLGKKEGAKLMTGGNRVGTTGYYFEPTIFADVKDNMAIAKEEVSCMRSNVRCLGLPPPKLLSPKNNLGNPWHLGVIEIFH